MVGDVFSVLSSVAAGSVLDIQPGAGVEVVIHNIYHEDNVDLQWYDGTNTLTFSVMAGAGAETNLQFHCKNALRVRIKNTHASAAKLLGYDGVQTK